VLLIAPKRTDDQTLKNALQPLLGRIDISAMREANLRAAGGNRDASPDEVARWLWDRANR